YDGTLAIDLMSRYDIELDFAAHKLNYISPDHCPGRVIYWPVAAVGVAPITLHNLGLDAQRNGQADSTTVTNGINAPQLLEGNTVSGLDFRTRVVIDGKNFTATIDTGSPVSTMSTEVAAALFGVAGPSAAPFEHSFHSLSFGDVAVTNPRFVIRPDRM